jgi:hypothetical protein
MWSSVTERDLRLRAPAHVAAQSGAAPCDRCRSMLPPDRLIGACRLWTGASFGDCCGGGSSAALTRRELAWRASGWAGSASLARLVTRLDPAGGYIRVVSR